MTRSINGADTIPDILSNHAASLADIASIVEFPIHKYPIQIPEADDTGRFNRCLDAAIAVGGAVLLGRANLTISTGITKTGNVNIIGQGAVINSSDLTKEVLRINGASNCFFSGFKITATGVTARNSSQVGFLLYQSNQCVIDNIHVDGTAAGGIMVSQTNDTKIVNCDVRNTKADGIHITGFCKRINVLGNTLYNTGDDSISVVSYTSDGDVCEGINVVGNNIFNSNSRGLSHIGGKSVNFSNNIINGTSSSGILVNHDNSAYSSYIPTNTIITGNQIKNAGNYGTKAGNQYGIEIGSSDCQNVSISDNSVRDGSSRGISGFCSGLVVKGNNVYNNNSDGINLGGGASANWISPVVDGNHVELNGAYGIYLNYALDAIVKGNSVINNNATSGNSGIDNVHFDNCNKAIVAENQSIDNRSPKLVERSYEFDSCTDCYLSSNKEDLGTNIEYPLPNMVMNSCTKMKVVEGMWNSADPSDITTYRAGQQWWNYSNFKLWIFTGSAWKSTTLA